MSNQHKLWRPGLFNAVGAGFQDDATVQDGIHLHWVFDPDLGMPYASEQQEQGSFRICILQDNLPCLPDADLFDKKIAHLFSVASDKDPSPDFRLDELFEPGIRFLKKSDGALNLSIHHFYNLLNYFKIHKNRLTDDQIDFLNYLEDLIDQLKSEIYPKSPSYEIAEVCAVDVRFVPGSGLNDTGTEDPSTNSGCLAPFLSLFMDQISARVKAYNRQGQVVDEDWVGKHPLTFGTGGLIGRKNKLTAQLRAPGIYFISIEPIINKPRLDRDEIRWVFCEAYCRADIWQCPDEMQTRFHVHKSFYTPQRVQDFIYAPFKKSLDWAETAGKLIQHLVNIPETQEMVAQPNSYDMSRYQMELTEATPDPQFSSLKLPFLAGLISSGLDSVMAMILGMHFFLKSPVYNKRDIKIEGTFPLFEPANIKEINGKIAEIAKKLDLPFSPDHELALSDFGAFSTHDPNHNIQTTLCALVMCPEISAKPAPPAPEDLTTTVSITDLPDQADEDQANLFVDAKINIPETVFSILPYQVPIAYEILRKISTGPFINVMEDEETDEIELNDLGLLPPVHIPGQAQDEAGIIVKDSFSVAAEQDESLQYSATAFDIFGRPSAAVTSAVQDIPLPCNPPTPPTNLSARIVSRGQDIKLELYLSLSTQSAPLEALPQTLEMAIHQLPNENSTPAELITWTGEIPARLLQVNYNSDHSALLLDTLLQSCLKLSWSGDQLNRTPVSQTFCETAFPSELPVLESFAPPLLGDPDSGFSSYKLTMKLGRKDTLSAGDYRWCVRIRIQGLCQSGADLFSLEPCTPARTNIPAEPPEVEQPPLVLIPQSTYPDGLGDAYYDLDLEPFIPVALRDSRPLLNVYKIVLSHLTEDPAAIVDGDFFTAGGQTVLQNLAKASRTPYERVNQQPIEFDAEHRFFPVKVRGDLEQYHVLGIIGCTPHLEEKEWSRSTVILFKTPAKMAIPALNFLQANTYTDAGQRKIDLLWQAFFAEPVAFGDPEPKIQVVRHDLSTDRKRFVAERTGTWQPELQQYRFAFTGDQVDPWHQYRYEAKLMLYSPRHDLFLKADRPTGVDFNAKGEFNDAPFPKSDVWNITPVAGGLEISAEFNAGEFEFSLTKALDDTNLIRQTGRLTGGQVHSAANATLSVDKAESRYTLKIIDPNDQPGIYTLRLFHGQLFTWSNKIEYTP